jgi:addiction module RelE/StbE family toxin
VAAVVWTLWAQAKLHEAAAYIAKDNPYAAKRVRKAIEQAAESLAEFPNRGRHGHVDNTRELTVQRTKYFLTYRVVSNTVQILDLVHSSLDTPEALH